MPGLGNVDPHGYVRPYEAARCGDAAAARAEQARLTRLFTIIEVAAPARVGRISGAAERERVAALVADCGPGPAF